MQKYSDNVLEYTWADFPKTHITFWLSATAYGLLEVSSWRTVQALFKSLFPFLTYSVGLGRKSSSRICSVTQCN